MKHLPFGSTCSCYQIGDYVIKLFTHKWGFGKVVCPDVFWAIKNIESNYYFNEYSNKIEGGFEIQRFLNKEINEEDIEKLKASILNDGYEIPIDFCVSNLGVLNSYMDADCFDPNLLPDWFKQNPLVVIDRDLFELRKTSKKKTLRRIIK